MNKAANLQTTGEFAEPYGTRVAPATVRIERILPGPVERVWSYLTESDKRARWLAAGPMQLRDGGSMSLTWRNHTLSGGKNSSGSTVPAETIDHAIDGVVTRCEPMHLLAFNWAADGSGMETIFELSEHGGDTRLVITQKRITERSQLIGVSTGWHAHVGVLVDILSGTMPRLFWPEVARLRGEYEKLFLE